MPLSEQLFSIMMALAIVIILIGLLLALRLKKVATGGVIGKAVNTIVFLIFVFTAGYGGAFLLPYFGTDYTLVYTGVILLLGAVFVLLVVWIIRRLLKRVLKALEIAD
jgi:hypothetical protein